MILVKGVDQPVSVTSDGVTMADLKAGKVATLKVLGAGSEAVEEAVGGPLTGSLKCLDGDCKQVAVYFRIYQGAGYIFEQSAEGYKIVNSVGSVTSIAKAQEHRQVAQK
jgi:hypothetical protein